ncbi:DNA-binding transcriptional LysR family regulator [Paraburkholderia sp. GAS199]|uniref:LysR family transcriptional regulator n=1 Tax=Paraburkholderia sp. GAS199 TaxID=3035126 RepID=UPI003D237798
MSRVTGLNYHHAELLFHVLRSRTLTDAAQALHISQPSVTKQLKWLEDDLEIRLFKKEGRRLVPTAEALLLVDEVERTRASLASLNELAARIKSGVAGSLKICAIPALAHVLLPGTIQEFRRTYPSINIEVKVENSWRILDLVETQQIDIGICRPFRELRQVEDTALLKMGIVCVARRDDVITTAPHVGLPDLRGRPVVMVEVYSSSVAVQNAVEACRLDRDVFCHVSTSTLACEIVLRTGVVALVDSLTAASYRSRGLAVFELPELESRNISLLRPKHRPSSGFGEAFVRALKLEAASFTHPEMPALNEANSSVR